MADVAGVLLDEVQEDAAEVRAFAATGDVGAELVQAAARAQCRVDRGPGAGRRFPPEGAQLPGGVLGGGAIGPVGVAVPVHRVPGRADRNTEPQTREVAVLDVRQVLEQTAQGDGGCANGGPQSGGVQA
ncbi:hypothetical protein GCM10010342_62540 [Streptomyces anulatus]|nr:hypothetical protein GCM10010342_62540 [Streptomyces anulatus]